MFQVSGGYSGNSGSKLFSLIVAVFTCSLIYLENHQRTLVILEKLLKVVPHLPANQKPEISV